jgi:uncharacterized protein YifE (UPF0438 family)
MTLEARKAHLQFLEESLVIFPEIAKLLGNEDASRIRKYGCWYDALDRGILPVLSEAQRHFVEAARGKAEPITEHELLWVKYKKLQAQALMHATSAGRYSRAHGYYGNTDSSAYNP